VKTLLEASETRSDKTVQGVDEAKQYMAVHFTLATTSFP
jgi:hypothetical protein